MVVPATWLVGWYGAALGAMSLPFGLRLALLKATKFPTMEGFPAPAASTDLATDWNQGTGSERL